MSMYTGDNKTALASQRLIADALLALLQSRSFVDISISELCKEAQVSRQTFYTLFQSKENVVFYELEDKYSFSFELLTEKEKITLQDLSHCYSLYLGKNFDFIKLIVDNGLTQLLFDSLHRSILTCKRIIPQENEEHAEYIAFFTAGGLVSIAKNYIRKGPSASPDFIETLTYSLFSGSFFYR